MNHDILCTWLGLPKSCWPPDPYALLGVPQGEKDVARIEQQVHERLSRLRGYQLSHPEEATEAMNRLAQAFIQVTDCLSRPRKAPVTIATCSLPRNGTPQGPIFKPKPSKEDTAVGQKTVVDWRETPPPVRGAAVPPPPIVEEPEPPSDIPLEPAPVVMPEASQTPSLETIAFLGQRSPDARAGLATWKDLQARITQTRQVSLAWKHAGKYLRNPKRMLTKASEETDLAHRMDYLFELMEEYPAFMGHPGKPGYRVVAMARLEMTTLMFKALDEQQREALAKDWDAGEKCLREHRRYLLKRVKGLKRRNPIERFVYDHFWWLLGGLAGVIIVVLAMMLYGWL